MLKVLSNILCDLDPKVKVIGQKAGICDGVPSTSALVTIELILLMKNFCIVEHYLPVQFTCIVVSKMHSIMPSMFTVVSWLPVPLV